MAIKKGKVVERRLYIEVDGEKHFVPKACTAIKGDQLAAFSGTEVEVLLAKDKVLAIRALDPRAVFPWGPIITCYLMPPDIVFDERMMKQIEPIITKSLLASGELDESVVKQLNVWQEQNG